MLNSKTFLLFLTLGILYSCTLTKVEKSKMSEQNFELPNGCDFNKVTNNSTLSSECTPKLDSPHNSNFRGLLINTPEKIILPKDYSLDEMNISPTGQILEGKARFPVAGRYLLQGAYIGRDVGYEIVVTAVDDKGRSYSGKMLNLISNINDPRDVPKFDLLGNPLMSSPNNGNHSGIGGSFNLDLIQNLGVPLKSSVYTIYASFEDFQSNIMTVTVSVE